MASFPQIENTRHVLKNHYVTLYIQSENTTFVNMTGITAATSRRWRDTTKLDLAGNVTMCKNFTFFSILE